MRKMFLFILIITFFNDVSAQYSSKKMEELFNSIGSYNLSSKVAKVSKSNYQTLDSLIKVYSKDSCDFQVRQLLFSKIDILQSGKSYNARDSLITDLEKNIFKIKKQFSYMRRDLKLLKSYVDKGHDRFFFPAYQGRETLKFYENDSVHIKLFRNNFVNYSPSESRMVLTTEVINDYFGPFRIGMGFQIKSDAKTDSLSTVDSTVNEQRKLSTVSDLKNKGGDINVNVAVPFLQFGTGFSFVSLKSSLFNNIGFSLPVFSKPTSEFVLTNYTGVNGALFARGILDKISILMDFSVGYTTGNKTFKKIITDAGKDDPTSFWLNKIGMGLDFKDAYRLQVDLFTGNSFVKKNFPASVTFTIRPQ